MHGLRSSATFSLFLGSRVVSGYSLFVKTTAGCVILNVYVGEIIITDSGIKGIEGIKMDLHSKLQIKNLGRLQ